MPRERLIDANAFEEECRKRIDMQELYLPVHIKEFVIDEMPEVEAIRADDNFGFAAYIIENNKYGIRVEESWNKDLDDEEMMAVMTGLIQDILADERLTRLWKNAMDMSKFLMGIGDDGERRN